jgi:hypothetical protein
VKKLQIFKPGKHTDVKGIVIDFTEDMLRACAAAYDPAKHEAPLVIGHPKMDDPAFGWAKAISYSDTERALVVDPDQVEPQFAEMVNAGRFKKISPSFYLPDSPNNPTPGQLYLRHVGFLGAAAPAVKGLKSASFADSEAGVVEFVDVAPWRFRSLGALLRGLREWIISKNTIEEADRVMPGYLIDDIESAPEGNTVGAAYSEPPEGTHSTAHQETVMLTQEQQAAAAKLKADQEALARKTAEFAERENALKAAEAAARVKEIKEFVAALVTAGKVLPRDQDGLVAYMAGPDEAGVIEFGEGDAKKSEPADAWLRGFLEALPKQVDFKERSAADDEPAGTVSFAAPPGYAVDPARLELHNKALAYQGAHPGTTYEAAITAVQK